MRELLAPGIVILSHTGYISLDALRWCADTGVHLVHIDPDGRILAYTATTRPDDPRLRRAQALAETSGADMTVAQLLIDAKLAGQADIAERILDDPDTARFIRDSCQADLRQAMTLDAVRRIEADAAAAYFTGWPGRVDIPFAARDRRRVPEHWIRFDGRRSPINGIARGARNAVTPINAMLNYGYALAEAECRFATLAVGLDPGLGVLHVDHKARDSLALDLLEALRPTVEAHILTMLATRDFHANDFHERRDGTCRLLAPLTHDLAETIPHLARTLAPHAEAVAHAFAAASGKPIERRTPLTGANIRASSPAQRARVTARPSRAAIRPCEICGTPLKTGVRRWCGQCAPDRIRESGDNFARGLNHRLAELRAAGEDPTNTPQVRAKQSQANARRKAEQLAWDRAHPAADADTDWQTILPTLADVPLRTIRSATGLSTSAASRIRNGRLIPHRRHWAALRALASLPGGGPAAG